MARQIPTDAEVYAAATGRDRYRRQAVDHLAREIRYGDATTRKEAEEALRNLGLLAREVAAIKRHLKS